MPVGRFLQLVAPGRVGTGARYGDGCGLRAKGQGGGDLVGVNNRSLRTFEVDLETTALLSILSPVRALLVSESGIFTPDDVSRVHDAHAQAILVGESLRGIPPGEYEGYIAERDGKLYFELTDDAVAKGD